MSTAIENQLLLESTTLPADLPHITLLESDFRDAFGLISEDSTISTKNLFDIMRQLGQNPTEAELSVEIY